MLQQNYESYVSHAEFVGKNFCEQFVQFLASYIPGWRAQVI